MDHTNSASPSQSAASRRTYRPYDEASKWARDQGIRSFQQWHAAGKAGSRPLDIPSCPNTAYADQWKGWREFLGTSFVSFAEAQAAAREAGVRGREEWRTLAAQRSDLPASPHTVYRDEWAGWEAFTGFKPRGGVSIAERVLAAELSRFVHVDRSTQTIYVGTRKGRRDVKKVDIVLDRDRVLIEYDGNIWHKNSRDRDIEDTLLLTRQGWRVVRIREQPLEILSDNDLSLPARMDHHQRACAVLRHLVALGVIHKSRAGEIQEYAAAGLLRADGAESDAVDLGNFRDFESARQWARELGKKYQLKSHLDWNNLMTSGLIDIPEDICRRPDLTYVQSWGGWHDFLDIDKRFAPYAEASAWATANGIKSARDWVRRRPENMPSRPSDFYEEWAGWESFCGIKLQRAPRVGSSRERARERFIPFGKARELAQGLCLKSALDWRRMSAEGRRPECLPSNPNVIYPEWTNWPDFLGLKSVPRTRTKTYTGVRGQRVRSTLVDDKTRAMTEAQTLGEQPAQGGTESPQHADEATARRRMRA